jgi:hypothetical protein
MLASAPEANTSLLAGESLSATSRQGNRRASNAATLGDLCEPQCMQRRPLFVYINDHVAGSVAALELIEHFISSYDGQPLEAFLCRS